ncbi:MAG: hypothetical protein KAG89_17980 [Fulvimarina manganoxydans]|uniref:hypothetical protein n=1 Tax=Fulvimarina manganoxydans TaxID=937218 RepID=UPI00235675CB|nr:hypothetical protein [Fulvimarina manganoxydans]MCK5934053.1 hypothetical protein [Fulvimarina manganoxydans]
MTGDFPKAGQVFGYHFLWQWQAKRGETEGRKKRNVCAAVIVTNDRGKHVVFIAPITKQEPDDDRAAIEIPKIEARRAKLDTDIRLWIILDEMNSDIVEESYTLEERTAKGAFSPAFTESIVRGILAIRKAGKLRVTGRV